MIACDLDFVFVTQSRFFASSLQFVAKVYLIVRLSILPSMNITRAGCSMRISANNKEFNPVIEMLKFAVSLQVKEPWKLVHIDFDEEEDAWHIFIDFERGALFSCPHCGTMCTAHDTEMKKWRHLDFWTCKTWSRPQPLTHPVARRAGFSFPLCSPIPSSTLSFK